jgi:hypothetical protein
VVRSALFHGTAHWFRTGEIVSPTIPATGIAADAAAWGTPHAEVAAHYSAQKAAKADQPPLFSPFYEVETTSDDLRTHPKINSVGDRKGMRVKGLAGYADYDGEVM